MRGARDPLERAGPVRSALADLIVGHEQDGSAGGSGLERADRLGEVAPDQRSRIAVVDLQLGERLVVLDPDESEQRRDQVGVVGRNVQLSCAARQQRAGHDERHVQRLLVGVVPLLVHSAVRALHVAVIGAEDHDRVLVCAAGLQSIQHAGDLLTDRGLQLVVELQVRLDPGLRRAQPGPEVDHALLTARLRRQVLVARRSLVDMGHRRGVVAQPLRERDDAEERIVVWVQERADREPRLIARPRRLDAAAARSSRRP